MSNIEAISDENFDSTVQSDKPVLVQFTADWCGPCRAIKPILEQLSEEMKEQVKIVKIDIDENPANAQKLGVRGLPSLYVFKNGSVAEKLVGTNTKQIIKDTILKAIDK